MSTWRAGCRSSPPTWRPCAASNPRVLLVGERGGYPAAVGAALAMGLAPEDERLTFVQTNSWASRHERLLDLALG